MQIWPVHANYMVIAVRRDKNARPPVSTGRARAGYRIGCRVHAERL